MVDPLPYGSWPSPVPAEMLVTGASLPTDVLADGGVTWWSESRPGEGGREQLVRRDPDGTCHDLLPDGWSVRTRVHEYGGGAWWVDRGTVFLSSWSDQRLYRLDPGAAAPVPLSPPPPSAHAWRFADHRTTPDGAFVVTVRESHAGDEARNEVVALPAVPPGPDGVPADAVTVLATGPDFVAAPRVSPDGRRLAWLSWDHPDLPWDATVLWVADLAPDGDGGLAATGATVWAGGPGESLVQPEWAPDGTLFVGSDRTGWWNVYRVPAPGELVPVCPVEAEVGGPAWRFGQSRYVVGADGTVRFTVALDGAAHLVEVPAAGGGPVDRVLDALDVRVLRADGDRLVAIAVQVTREPEIVELAGPEVRVLRAPRDLGLDVAVISRGRRVDFPSAGGRTAHAWFYPPAGDGVTGPPGELPPLIVKVHGGPTGAADPQFDLATQFWTTRGFAVVDVDYGGSTGYGRPYRQLLNGAWGVVDVEDVCAAARWLAAEGLVDGGRLAIRGSSAGGFTTLSALATTDVFAAGASLYGVADLASLARDTHKFESRYLDRLVGPWPEAEALYAERSPISHLDGLTVPLIVLQGLQDEVVPPAQAELIVTGLRERGVPCAYLTFADEQHGFRIAANIVRATSAELAFYGRVFGFTPAGPVEPVEVENAAALG